jgi:hypothetical protein
MGMGGGFGSESRNSIFAPRLSTLSAYQAGPEKVLYAREWIYASSGMFLWQPIMIWGIKIEMD